MKKRRPQIPPGLRNEWRQTYEETSYRELPWFSPRPYRSVREAVRAGWLPPRARVLDVGCGAGTNALFLARSGFRVSGVDLAPGAIRAARARAVRAGIDIDFRVGDALRLPYAKGCFGGVIDIGCFHTLPLGLRSSYSREVARVLRRRGRYLLSWVAREYTGSRGPPHRPSLGEVTGIFERDFIFRHTEFQGDARDSLPAYYAILEKRAQPQPPTR